ncbi:MAG: TetR/AcrR family transcriptional regulator [Steroidobacteraceae bacterium]
MKRATRNAADSAPPLPRKVPRQRRSRATVEFILEAARRILYEKGVKAITTRRVAEHSGVAVGSLYQYFPNREAILARLAEDEAQRESQALHRYIGSLRQLPLTQYLDAVVARTIRSERRMLNFGGEFYQRYTQHFQVGRRMGHERSGHILDVETITRDTLRSFELHATQIGEPDRLLAAYLLARGLPTMLGVLVVERPELLGSGRLEAILARVAAAVVDARPAGRKGTANANNRRRPGRRAVGTR